MVSKHPFAGGNTQQVEQKLNNFEQNVAPQNMQKLKCYFDFDQTTSFEDPTNFRELEGSRKRQ